MANAQVVSSKVFQLIEILGSHSITVKDLRALLVAMRSDRPNFSPQRTLQILNCLQTMAQITGPEVYFHLTGVNSAIVRAGSYNMDTVLHSLHRRGPDHVASSEHFHLRDL